MNELLTPSLRLVLDELYSGDPVKGYPPSHRYRICLRSKDLSIGHITIRVGNDEILREYSGHISYAIDEAYRGHRFAAEACGAIIPLAHSLGIKPIRITCDPNNIASKRTCVIAGAQYLGEVKVPSGNYVFENGGRVKAQYEIIIENQA